MESVEGPPPRVGALSLPSRIAVAVTVGVVMVGALYHLGMVFLHVAPSNTISRGHAETISEYIYPEFEQNWKLFAPNPLQQNVHVEARAEVLLPGGAKKNTAWVDMTGQDIDAMRHDPAPSHSTQNELRRAWIYYSDTHDTSDQPNSGDGSDMSRTYLQRILERRFGAETDGGRVVRIQARVATTQVPQPSWAGGQPGPSVPSYRELPWWIANTTSSGQENAS